MSNKETKDKELMEKYRKQLNNWIKATKLTKKKLATEITPHFCLGGTQGISEHKYGRAVRGENKAAAGVEPSQWNILYVLASLHAVDIISIEEAQKFLSDYKISMPDDAEPSQVWSEFEQGKARYIAHCEKQKTTDPAKKEKRTVDLTTYRLFAVASITIVLLAGFILFSLTPKSILTQCKGPSEASNPTFRGDLGISQFQTNPDGLNSSPLNNSIRKIGINSLGIWVGYMNGSIDGISLYNGANWYHCHGLQISTGQNINDFLFYEDGIFVATDGGGVAQLSPNGWQGFDMSNTDPRVYSFFNSGTRIWASNYLGVAELIDNHWQTTYQASSSGLKSNQVYQYLRDSNGYEWFGLLSNGISRLSPNGEWQNFDSEIPLQSIRGIAIDQNSGLWFASDGQGIGYYHDQSWQQFTSENSNLQSNNIYDIEIDKWNRVWITGPDGTSYSNNQGQSWENYSTAPSIDIEFGCPEPACPDPYGDEHIWLVLSDNSGLGHSRIPPREPSIRLISSPTVVQLQPGEAYIFEIEVEVVEEGLSESNGDALFSADALGTDLFNSYPIIAVRGTISNGQHYTFTNEENPIIAPDEPGAYQLSWRVQQNRRPVTPLIIIQFEVVSN